MLQGRLLIVSGKGGVGKSAVAAAIALAAHRRGRSVLSVSMAGDGGLASHLGSPPLGFSPLEVRPGLHALAVDRSQALLEYLRVQVGIPALATFGPVARAFDALASAAPAIREIVTMGKVLWEVKREAWDLVVADAPPTGQIGSYLRSPRTITELVATGRIGEQAGWMQDLLLDGDRSALVLVTLPEELPSNETRETQAWLDSEQVVGRVMVVANRVLPRLEVEASQLPPGPAGDAARLHLSLWEEQQRWLGQVPSDLSLPYLFGVMTPAEVAARLADEWERT